MEGGGARPAEDDGSHQQWLPRLLHVSPFPSLPISLPPFLSSVRCFGRRGLSLENGGWPGRPAAGPMAVALGWRQRRGVGTCGCEVALERQGVASGDRRWDRLVVLGRQRSVVSGWKSKWEKERMRERVGVVFDFGSGELSGVVEGETRGSGDRELPMVPGHRPWPKRSAGVRARVEHRAKRRREGRDRENEGEKRREGKREKQKKRKGKGKKSEERREK